MRHWMLVFIAALGIVVANPIAGNAQQGGDFCGGIAGLPCPEGYTCVDDPRDDCDPLAGGADCGGICVVQHENACVDFCRSQGHTGRAFGDCVSNCTSGHCSFDNDCRTFSNYCDGCSCRALGVSEPDPVCDGTLVQCFVDPCLEFEAYCRGGQCALRPR